MNIAIIGQNCIFRDSLKILLNQVADFTVVFDGDEIMNLLDYQDILSINIVLFDYCNRTENFSTLINKTRELSENIKIMVMTDVTCYYYWINQKEYHIEGVILKDSGKQEFEKEIRTLIKAN
jgi:DNA-binding NarL/FixJ family response regulator